MCIANPSLRAVSGPFFLVFYHWAWQSGRFINFFPSAVISLSLVKTCLWLLWQTSLLSPNPDPSLHPSPLHTLHHPLTQGLVAKQKEAEVRFWVQASRGHAHFHLLPCASHRRWEGLGRSAAGRSVRKLWQKAAPARPPPLYLTAQRAPGELCSQHWKGDIAMLIVLISECNWI